MANGDGTPGTQLHAHRRRQPPSGALIVSILLALAAAVAGFGCSDDEPSQAAEESTTTAGPTTTAARAPTSPADSKPLTDHQLDLGSLGPVHVGMTLDEAQAATGVELREDQLNPDIDCVTWFPNDDSTASFIAIGGRVAVITVREPFATSAGIGVGASDQDVRDAYGVDRVEERTNRFGVKELIVTSSDPEVAHLGIIFALDTVGTNAVESVRTGLVSELDRDEGCA